MHFLPVWYLSPADSLRALRQAKLFCLRTIPYLLKNKKAWSY
ncbi:hypothetical protein [Hymenobacter chitinivorans]|uniref:Uncharacterized protein n=1 Tax=Hymenobacter chitinivorans DSM 11115 TaxID=1121954 RepID=A0A2M9B479_9BACT|nr:hypothetical protein [Hymenobacter chitinivorans]PJJ52760.1 hypothetical protein CLV45_3417 [Hymenobacter chitinivorans DSM 11115]